MGSILKRLKRENRQKGEREIPKEPRRGPVPFAFSRKGTKMLKGVEMSMK